MNNSTLGRKPSNDMKRNQGVSKSVARVSQMGDGESFAFNGQMGDGVNRGGRQTVCDNRYSIGASSDRIDMGLMQSQRRGNTSSSPKKIGPPATRDGHQMTIATASAGQPVGAGFHCPPVGNPDKINKGR